MNTPAYIVPQLVPELPIYTIRYVPDPSPDPGQPLE